MEQLCKRNAIIKAMHAPGTTVETRKTSMEQLKALPAAYGEMQAVYADYCKLEEHASTTTCTRLKQTGSSKARVCKSPIRGAERSQSRCAQISWR